MAPRAAAAAAAAFAALWALAAVAGAHAPTCFGAPSRDVTLHCDNAALQHMARPAPSIAPLELNAPCHPIASTRFPRVCWFGHASHGASETVALVGDSHASSWRSAVRVLADAQRWHALTIRRSSCPLSLARRTGPPRESGRCQEWVRATLRWLGGHPQIHTVFVTASVYSGVATRPGQDPYAVAVDGARAALAALPPSIQHVIVLRDTPRSSLGTLDCVQRVLTRHQPTAGACSLPVTEAIAPDPFAEAAKQLGAPRFGVIDLTDFFCDPDRCFPVIGGALVYKDLSHMTTAFGTTLGPYLESAYRQLVQ